MAKNNVEPINEATKEDKEALLSIQQNEADIVQLRGHNIKVRWLHPSVMDWISALLVHKADKKNLMARCAALVRLNGFFKAHLFYWFVWRWYYYIRQYNSLELTPLFEVAVKKKVQEEKMAYLNAMTFLLALDTTEKQMTKEEAEHILQELRLAKDGKSPKSTE